MSQINVNAGAAWCAYSGAAPWTDGPATKEGPDHRYEADRETTTAGKTTWIQHECSGTAMDALRAMPALVEDDLVLGGTLVSAQVLEDYGGRVRVHVHIRY